MMDPIALDRVEEPYIKATIITKSDFVGAVMTLCIENVANCKPILFDFRPCRIGI